MVNFITPTDETKFGRLNIRLFFLLASLVLMTGVAAADP